MHTMKPLPRSFYDRPTLTVARELLGCLLIYHVNGTQISGRIVETEGYVGAEDMACHARRGQTPANAMMFGPPGHAYIYFTYGIHWLLNAVTEPEGRGCAVLLRAIDPQTGLDSIAANRTGRPPKEWTSGPAKLTRALGIDGSLNGVDLTHGDLVIAPGEAIADRHISTGPRIGIDSVPEPWRSKPWRFWISDNPHVSKRR